MFRTARMAICLSLAGLLGACAHGAIPQGSAARGDPARTVAAAVATNVPGTLIDADDPALWADARDPSRALLFGTDKTTGLYVHNLDGTMRQFFADGPMNNVDLRPDFIVDGRPQVLVAATERRKFGIMTYLLDPDTLETRPYGFIPTDMGEPYGFCMGKLGDTYYLAANNKAGDIRLYTVAARADGPVAKLDRSFRVGSQPEGCTIDDATQQLYVGEEDVAIWRFSLAPGAAPEPRLIASTDGIRLTADVEGLTLMRDAGGTYLIASSQGDSTFPVWRIEADGYVYKGRFAVEGGEHGATRSTDGLHAWSGPIGPFPSGAIAFHNAEATPAGNQDYKIVDWRDVKKALNLP